MSITADPATWGDPDLLVVRPVPGTSRLDRLRASTRGRRILPTSLALRATDLVYRTATRVLGGKRAAAEATMRAILPPGTSEEEIRRLAPRHVASMARAWELTWREGELFKLAVQGEEHLRAAQATGRGILISYVHYGPELGWIRASPLIPMLTVMGEWIAEPTHPGFNGLQVEHRRHLLADADMHIASVGSVARQMLTVLKAGGAVLLAMDVPGPKATRFLGKEVEMADGTARVATSAKAVVLPGALVPDGERWALRFLPPLDPADFPDRDALHQALADIHSGIVEQAPEHYASPLRPGFWRADAERWVRA